MSLSASMVLEVFLDNARREENRYTNYSDFRECYEEACLKLNPEVIDRLCFYLILLCFDEDHKIHSPQLEKMWLEKNNENKE